MLIIPAIDIKDNKCVRLYKGSVSRITIFKKNCLDIAYKWFNYGIDRIHLVDLDGALFRKPKNLLTIKSIIKYFKNFFVIQLGGGIRDIETIQYYFDIGIDKIILGTKAVTDINFFENISEKFKEKIILSLDLKGFKIAINGWKKYYNYNLLNYLKKINNYEFESIIYTDIDRDGTLEGINIKKFIKILKITNKPVIISGGLSKLHDIRKLFFFQKNKLFGLICGKSIYKGNIDFETINNKLKIFNKIIFNKFNKYEF